MSRFPAAVIAFWEHERLGNSNIFLICSIISFNNGQTITLKKKKINSISSYIKHAETYMQFSTRSPNASVAAAFSSTWAFSIVILINQMLNKLRVSDISFTVHLQVHHRQNRLHHHLLPVRHQFHSMLHRFPLHQPILIFLFLSLSHPIQNPSYACFYEYPSHFNPIEWSKRCKYISHNTGHMRWIEFGFQYSTSCSTQRESKQTTEWSA